jgi:hypothetical protein
MEWNETGVILQASCNEMEWNNELDRSWHQHFFAKSSSHSNKEALFLSQ